MPCDKEGNKTGCERNAMGGGKDRNRFPQKNKSKFLLMPRGEKIVIGRNMPLIYCEPFLAIPMQIDRKEAKEDLVKNNFFAFEIARHYL